MVFIPDVISFPVYSDFGCIFIHCPNRKAYEYDCVSKWLGESVELFSSQWGSGQFIVVYCYQSVFAHTSDAIYDNCIYADTFIYRIADHVL